MKNISRAFAVSLILLGFASHAFAAWPWSKKEKKPPKQEPKQEAAYDQFEEQSPIRSESGKRSLEKMPIGERASEGAGLDLTGDTVPQRPPSMDVPRLPEVPLREATSLPSEPKETQIVEIQRQINEIIRINESLKMRYQSQAAEIQKIVEQSKIHQKILNDLEMSSANVPPSAPEDPVQKEKLKLIDEQTKKNQDYLSLLRKDDSE